MRDKATPSKNEVALSGRGALALQSSGLVKRGLELIPVLKKPQFRVLIAEDQVEFVHYLSEFVVEGVGRETYDVGITSVSPHSDQILQLLERDAFDIVVLILNNVLFSDLPPNRKWQQSAERWVVFITQMMAIRAKPIIALCGWMTGNPVLDDWLKERVSDAGAKFLTLPVGRELLTAIEESLAALGKLPKVSVATGPKAQP